MPHEPKNTSAEQGHRRCWVEAGRRVALLGCLPGGSRQGFALGRRRAPERRALANSPDQGALATQAWARGAELPAPILAERPNALSNKGGPEQAGFGIFRRSAGQGSWEGKVRRRPMTHARSSRRRPMILASGSTRCLWGCSPCAAPPHYAGDARRGKVAARPNTERTSEPLTRELGRHGRLRAQSELVPCLHPAPSRL